MGSPIGPNSIPVGDTMAANPEPADLRFAEEPGGHRGVLAGRRARDHSWATFLGFIGAHDDGAPGDGS